MATTKKRRTNRTTQTATESIEAERVVWEHLVSIENKLDSILDRLDRLSATVHPAPPEERSEESEAYKAMRYLWKIHHLRDRHAENLSDWTNEFLLGVVHQIKHGRWISRRQAAVVDRIIGEMS